MADILLDVQTAPSTPATGQGVIYIDSVTKKASLRNDAGIIEQLSDVSNDSVAAQAGFAADTYLAGSGVLLGPAPAVGVLYYCSFDVVKTGAGLATPIIQLRFGTLGTVVDTSRLTFTFPAQTAVADIGMFEIWALFRSIGAAGVLQGRARLTHENAITGLSVLNSPLRQVTSGGFDTTPFASIMGLSVNGGASAAWTAQLVEAYARTT